MLDCIVNRAVFAKGQDILLVDPTPKDGAIDDALARGFTYCGMLSAGPAGPIVRCVPGEFEAQAMIRAGEEFAALLGPLLQRQQLLALEVKGMKV